MELELLVKNVEHFQEIVSMQQNHARVTGFTGAIPPDSPVGDAPHMAAGRRVEAIRKHEPAGTVFAPGLPLARMEDAA